MNAPDIYKEKTNVAWDELDLEEQQFIMRLDDTDCFTDLQSERLKDGELVVAMKVDPQCQHEGEEASAGRLYIFVGQAEAARLQEYLDKITDRRGTLQLDTADPGENSGLYFEIGLACAWLDPLISEEKLKEGWQVDPFVLESDDDEDYDEDDYEDDGDDLLFEEEDDEAD